MRCGLCSEEIIYMYFCNTSGYQWILGKGDKENFIDVSRSECFVAIGELGKALWKIWHLSGSEVVSEIWLVAVQGRVGRGSAPLLEGAVLQRYWVRKGDVCRHREHECLFPFSQWIGSLGWSSLRIRMAFPSLDGSEEQVGKGKKLNKALQVIIAICWSWF